MGQFEIHRQLQSDTYDLGRFPLCRILLHRNGALPWFILVPETDAIDLLDLAVDLRDSAMREAAAVAAFIKELLGCPKVNFAAIGNLVPQLHLHVVGRRPGDVCWPAPVWGHLTETREYTDTETRAIGAALARHSPIRLVQSRAL